MNEILNSIAEPFLNGNLDTGRINVEELTIWPRWSHPKFRTIFSYIRGNEKTVVPVVMGKIYTFRDLQLLIDEHLNIDGDDKPVAKLRYNNGRVIWHVFPEVKKSNDKLSTGMINFLRLHNIELSAGMKDLLKLNETNIVSGITTGKPVDESSIQFTFSDTSKILFTCDQADDY